MDAAVNEAAAETDRRVRFKESQQNGTLEFDIAVTISSEEGGSEEAKINVFQMALFGSDAKSTKIDETVSRIKFGLQIDPETDTERHIRSIKNNPNQVNRNALR